MVLRRLRGIATTAIFWGVLWLPFGIAMGLYRYWRPVPPTDVISDGNVILEAAWFFATWGAISGAGFAVALMVLERRRSLRELSLGRFALWGALGASALPVVVITVVLIQGYWFGSTLAAVVMLSLSVVLGAGCGAGTLIIARRTSVPEGLPPSPSSLTSA